MRKECGEKATKPKGNYNEINVDGKLEDVGKTALAHTIREPIDKVAARLTLSPFASPSVS